MAALEVIALVEGTPQLRAPGASDTYTMPRAVDHAEQSVTGVKNINISGETAEYNAAQDPSIFWDTNHTYDYANLVIPPAVRFAGNHTIQQSGFVFGMGSLFTTDATIKNDPAVVANPSGFYILANSITFEADQQNLTQGLQTDCLMNTTFSRNISGSYTITSYTGYNAAGVISTDCTMTSRRGFSVSDVTGSGTLTSQAGFITVPLTKATSNTSLQLGGATLATTGNFSIRQVEAQQNQWNGGQRWKLVTGAATSLTATAAADHYYFLSSTSTVTLTLPDASTCSGLEIVVKKTGASGTINITSVSSQTFDGAASPLAISTQFHVARIISNGANWFILQNGAP